MELTMNMRDKIYNAIVNYAEYCNEDYTREGVNYIIDEWFENKKRLLDLFEKSKNWDSEKLRIKLSIEEIREFDESKINKEFDNLMYFCKDRYIKDYSELYRVFQELMFDGADDEGKKYKPKMYLSQRAAEKITGGTGKYGEIAIREGMKTAKVILALAKYFRLDKVIGSYINTQGEVKSYYNKWEAKIGDAFTYLSQNKILYMSLNPIDYCRMGRGKNFNSCYIWGKGEYRAGTLAYMCDQQTFICYTQDEKMDGIETMINRQCWFMNERGDLLQSRLYPQNEDSLTNVYESWSNAIVKEMEEITGIKHTKTLSREEVNNPGRICNDGVGYVDPALGAKYNVFLVEDTDRICLFDVARHQYYLDDDTRDDVNDYDTLQNRATRCCNCGSDGELHEIDGEYYCENCCFYCEYHGEWETGDKLYIEGYGYICDDAYYNSGEFFYCETCCSYFKDDNPISIDGNYFCSCECAEEAGHIEVNGDWYESKDVYQCDECGDDYYYENGIVTEDGHCYCCSRCAEKAGYIEKEGLWVKASDDELLFEDEDGHSDEQREVV